MEHFGHLGIGGFLWIQVLQFTNMMTWILRSGMRLEDRFLEHLGWAKIPLTLRPFGNETWLGKSRVFLVLSMGKSIHELSIASDKNL
jgi:hypothetical protein